MTGELLSPREAILAGFLDRVVAPPDLQQPAGTAAATLAQIDLVAHAATKMRARGPAIQAIRDAIAAEITLEDLPGRRASWG